MNIMALAMPSNRHVRLSQVPNPFAHACCAAMRRVVVRRLAPTRSALLFGVIAVTVAQGALARSLDPVVLSFTSVGDSRQDPVAADPTQLSAGTLTGQDARWLQNTKALARILREVAARKPSMLFFNGDMIMGYGNAGATSGTDVHAVVNSDLFKHHTQYAFWRGMVAPLIESGTYVVPVPGNHETQCKSVASSTVSAISGLTIPAVVCGTLDANGQDTLASVNGGKNAIRVNEDAWRANMGDLIIDASRLNRALPTGLKVSHVDSADHSAIDQLGTPQHQLSYSFDVGHSHFVVINTDPTGADSTAPTAWLQADMDAAAARGARHFFVFGHKPAYTYDFVGNKGRPHGLDAAPAKRDAFWRLIEKYRATYFCGHEHTFNMRRPVLADGRVSSSLQVLVGSGGSPFDVKAHEPGQAPHDRHYAWAHVKVRRSGKVQIDVHGFNDAFGPTRRLQQAVVAP